ncbi:MAG TPA: UDP-N-acetylmuramate dehydrogenase [Campylobacterales bacterium]|nr:UDP-N-acetylmuramate dehydrogenase [Campylobacterales bacterium]
MQIRKVNFSKFSSIRIGGEKEVYIINSPDEVDRLPPDTKIVGGANNLLISPSSKIPLGQLSKNFDYIKISPPYLHIGGATPNGKIFNFTKYHNIAGFEFFQHLPSTLGGAIKMNAGLKEYEIFNNLVAIRTERGWIDKENIEYSYRSTNIEGVIFEAKFKLIQGFQSHLVSIFQTMRSNQPKEPSLGSTFKNPMEAPAGKLLEQVKLKGFRVGNMAFSSKHANFLINLGGGKFSEAVELIEIAEKRVLEEFGIELEREIEIIY